MEMSREREQLIGQQSAEREEMMSRFTAERDRLNSDITSTLRDGDDRLMQAERDRQQVRFTDIC